MWHTYYQKLFKLYTKDSLSHYTLKIYEVHCGKTYPSKPLCSLCFCASLPPRSPKSDSKSLFYYCFIIFGYTDFIFFTCFLMLSIFSIFIDLPFSMDFPTAQNIWFIYFLVQQCLVKLKGEMTCEEEGELFYIFVIIFLFQFIYLYLMNKVLVASF